jgi:hypothetical protein
MIWNFSNAEYLMKRVPQGGDQSEPVCRWSKEFLEAGKKRLAGDTAREATSDEVKERASSRRPWLRS